MTEQQNATQTPLQVSDERTLREEKILDAAAALLIRFGYRKTTIDDVAREAGVGKGTIYLHWKDKISLFRAVMLRNNALVFDDMRQRIQADPNGGLFHRAIIHGMAAALENPLMTILLKGNSDLYASLKDVYDPQTMGGMIAASDTYFAQLQKEGLIRSDIPPSIISYMIAVMKVGIFNTPDVYGLNNVPTIHQITESLSEIVQKWLEPGQIPQTTSQGKAILGDFVNNIIEYGKQES